MNINDKDQQIIKGIKAGGLERQRWEGILFKEYQYFVAQSKHKLDKDTLKYTYADAVMVLIQHILSEQFRGEAAMKTYLHRIFNNKCVDAIRKKTTNKVKRHDTDWIGDWTHLSSRANSVLKNLINQEMVEDLAEGLGKLGERCKKLILLSAKGFNSKELAEMFSYKSAQAVRVIKNRCMKKWKEIKYFGELKMEDGE